MDPNDMSWLPEDLRIKILGQFLRQGDEAYAEGRIDDARDRYAEALRMSGGTGQRPLQRLAIVAREAGDFAQARELLGRLEPTATVLNDLGCVAFGQGDLVEAERAWRAAVEGGNRDALFNMALIAAEKGDPDAERGWLLRAADAGVTKAWVNLGCIAGRSGDKDAAAGWYRKALEDHPDVAAFNLGVIARDRGDTAAAREWFMHAADAWNADALAELEGLDELDDEAGPAG